MSTLWQVDKLLRRNNELLNSFYVVELLSILTLGDGSLRMLHLKFRKLPTNLQASHMQRNMQQHPLFSTQL